MDTMFVTAAMETPSLVLRFAAAFFFVVVAIFLAYMLFKAAKVLERADKVLADVDENGIPLMEKAGTTLDGVNANLGNVDEITKDVAGITDKLDKMASSVEGAVTTPARKAAAFGAGVQSAVSSFMKRDKPGDAGDGGSSAGSADAAAGDAPAAGGWSYADAPAAAADADVTADVAADATPSADAAGTAADARPDGA
ncbi:MAG: DUF948 domain-containing protein [Actinobacteria bacterium]|nr:DUF948 domain-containing protein [Actinomycetota bacterium]